MRALILLLAFALLGAPQPGARPAADSWPQFRGDPRLTGVARSPLAATLKLLWAREVGESIESSAAIAEGMVFVGTRPGGLVAVSLEDGVVRWTYPVGGEGIGESSPAVSGGLVFVGDLGGTVHAVRARDGRKAWTFKTGGEVKSSPVVAGDRVLIGSYDGHLYALRPRTGALLWKLRTDGPVHATAAVDDDVAYVTGCDQVFRGVRIVDGKTVFEVSSGAYTGASPALAGRIAFYGTFESEVLAVDRAARRVIWRYRHPERQFPFYSSAAVADDRVVVGGRDKLVHCLDARTGEALWTFATQGRVESSPAVAGGRVFVGSNDGRLYVLDLASGAKRWEFEAGAPLSASPAIAGGRLVIGAQDGRLFCFN